MEQGVGGEMRQVLRSALRLGRPGMMYSHGSCVVTEHITWHMLRLRHTRAQAQRPVPLAQQELITLMCVSAEIMRALWPMFHTVSPASVKTTNTRHHATP